MLSWIYQTIAPIRSLFSKSDLDRKLEEELATHIEFATPALLTQRSTSAQTLPDVTMTVKLVDAVLPLPATSCADAEKLLVPVAKV